MKNDVRWPSEIRGSHKLVAWLNRLLDACKKSAIHQVEVVNGVGKIRDGRAIISMNDQSEITELMFPFKIYGIENVSATDIQKALFANLGFNINDLTFQIRNGIVGGRSYINAPNAANTGQSIGSFDPFGNYEVHLVADCTDSPPNEGGAVPEEFFYQPSPNTGTTIVLDINQPTLISGLPKGSPLATPFTFSSQIALSQIPDDNGSWNWQAAFWLELVDDPLNSFYVNLMGIMYSDSGSNGRTASPFPNGANIVPLGFVNVYQLNKTGPLLQQITNIQTGNIVNRHAPFSTEMSGRWNEEYAALPAGKTKLYWYPGDQVVDDSAAIVDPTSGFSYFKIWQLVKTPFAGYTVAQTPSAPDWLQVGIST